MQKLATTSTDPLVLGAGRAYPGGPLAGHVLGYVNVSNKGVTGIERYVDDVVGVESVQGTTPAERPVRRRATVRLLVLDAAGDVLLYEDSDQGLTPPATWWSTPGGGIDPGESERDAAARELFEETGLRVAVSDFIGPIARRRVVHGYSDSVVEQYDVFYAVRTTRFEPDPGALTPEEQVTMQRWHWWSVAELRATTQRVWPSAVADLVAHQVAHLAQRGPDAPDRVAQAPTPMVLEDVEESTVPVALGHR